MEKQIMGMMMVVVMVAVLASVVQAAPPEPTPPPEPSPPEPPAPGKAALYGVVTNSVTGVVIAGALVALNGVYSAYSSSLGQYEIDDIEPGDYTLEAAKEGYITTAVFSVVLSEGITRIDITLIPIPQKANLYGTVTDSATGGALEGVSVALDTSYSAYTDSNGNYEISGIEPGSYTLKFEKEGYGLATIDIILPEGTTRVDASLVKEIVPQAEFYMPAKVTVILGDYLEGIGQQYKFRCTITNNGGGSGTHKLTFVGYHNGAEWDRLARNITLEPGQSYTWKYMQWLLSGSYKVTLTGDWEKDNYAQVTVYQ